MGNPRLIWQAGKMSRVGSRRYWLNCLPEGRPAADTVMYGPRGMGKTVLLHWFENEAKKGGTKDNPIRTSWTTPNKLTSPAGSMELLVVSGLEEAFEA